MSVYKLTESLSVAAQITPQDIGGLAAQGFTTVVCNRPDGESPGQAGKQPAMKPRYCLFGIP